MQTFLKDDTGLQIEPLQPDEHISVPSGATSRQRAIARTYNRLGGFLEALGSAFGLATRYPLAVWYVESGGRTHHSGNAVIRLEAHKLFKYWGKDSPAVFDGHFQFGGRNGVPGKGYQHQKYRRDTNSGFQDYHGDQALEYDAFSVAGQLAGSVRPAVLSSSWGGPQIMGFNYRIIGYDTPEDMMNAFQLNERWHVFGFFDYCINNGNAIGYLKNRDWVRFAGIYNGSSNAPVYGEKIRLAYEDAKFLKL